MKNSTKRKIIQWVTRILKYYPPINPPTTYESRKVQHFSYSKRLPSNHPLISDRELAKSEAVHNMAEFLFTNKLMDISFRPESKLECTMFFELDVVEPLR